MWVLATMGGNGFITEGCSVTESQSQAKKFNTEFEAEKWYSMQGNKPRTFVSPIQIASY